MSIFDHVNNRNTDRTPANLLIGAGADTGKIERRKRLAEFGSGLLRLLIGGVAVACRRRLKTIAIAIFRAAIEAELDHHDVADDDHGVTWNAGSEFTIERGD